MCFAAAVVGVVINTFGSASVSARKQTGSLQENRWRTFPRGERVHAGKAVTRRLTTTMCPSPPRPLPLPQFSSAVEGLDTSAIIDTGRRTRGVKVDFKAAAKNTNLADLGDDDSD